VPIKIGAQLYLKRFYESFGFVAQGDVYDEDGIPHICMIRAVV
jgi:ElaA protein